MASCLILDTGALIGIERKKPDVVHALRAARRKNYRILVPSVAYVEWIRGANQGIGKLVEGMAEHVGSERAISRLAGEALKSLGLDGQLHLADAIVAASARYYGGLLYTSDPEDMSRLLAVMVGSPVEIVRVCSDRSRPRRTTTPCAQDTAVVSRQLLPLGTRPPKLTESV